MGCLARYDTYVNEAQENPVLKSKPIQQTNRFEVLPKFEREDGKNADMQSESSLFTHPNVQPVSHQHLS